MSLELAEESCPDGPGQAWACGNLMTNKKYSTATLLLCDHGFDHTLSAAAPGLHRLGRPGSQQPGWDREVKRLVTVIRIESSKFC